MVSQGDRPLGYPLGVPQGEPQGWFPKCDLASVVPQVSGGCISMGSLVWVRWDFFISGFPFGGLLEELPWRGFPGLSQIEGVLGRRF
jgi:hypothetical protein